MRREYFVYILRCADGSYYTGITNNVDARVGEHQRGIHETCYTFTRRPLKLVYNESFNDVRLAIRLEKVIKGWSRAKKEAFINGERETFRKLSECKNKTHSKFFQSPERSEGPLN